MKRCQGIDEEQEDHMWTRLPQSREQRSSNMGAPRRSPYFYTVQLFQYERGRGCSAVSTLEITTVKFRLLILKIRTAVVSLDREDDNVGQEEQEIDEDKLDLVHSFCSGVFGSIVCDKAQKNTKLIHVRHKSIIDLKASSYILLTATVMINRPLDPYDLLSLSFGVSNELIAVLFFLNMLIMRPQTLINSSHHTWATIPSI